MNGFVQNYMAQKTVDGHAPDPRAVMHHFKPTQVPVIAQLTQASGFLAVYLAGIIVGNRPTRAHNSVVTFLDAANWLALQEANRQLVVVAGGPHRDRDGDVKPTPVHVVTEAHL